MCECPSSLPWRFFHSLLPSAKTADTDPLSCYFSNMCKVPPRNLVCPCDFVYNGSHFHMYGNSKSTPDLETPMYRVLVVYPSSLPCMQPMSNLSDPCASTLFGSSVEDGCYLSHEPNGITPPAHHRTRGKATSFLQPKRDLKDFCGSLQHVPCGFWP